MEQGTGALGAQWGSAVFRIAGSISAGGVQLLRNHSLIFFACGARVPARGTCDVRVCVCVCGCVRVRGSILSGAARASDSPRLSPAARLAHQAIPADVRRAFVAFFCAARKVFRPLAGKVFQGLKEAHGNAGKPDSTSPTFDT